MTLLKNNYFINALWQGCQTGGPQAGSITCKLHPPWLRKGRKHRDTSQYVMWHGQVWHPCSMVNQNAAWDNRNSAVILLMVLLKLTAHLFRVKHYLGLFCCRPDYIYFLLLYFVYFTLLLYFKVRLKYVFTVCFLKVERQWKSIM